MDLNLFATVVGILVAVAAAYHVAIRSGNFLRPQLRVRVGHAIDSKRYRTPIAVVFGIPRTPNTEYFAVALPVVVDCRFGNVKSLFVRFAVPEDRDATRTPVMRRFIAELPDPSCIRKHTNMGSVNHTDYEIPVLRRGMPALLFEILVFHRSEIQEPPEQPASVQFDDITVGAGGENSKWTGTSTLVCAMWSNDPSTMQSLALTVGLAARRRRGQEVLTPNRWGFVLLPAPHSLWKRRLILAQLRVTDSTEGNALCLGVKGIVSAHALDFLPVYFPPEDQRQ